MASVSGDEGQAEGVFKSPRAGKRPPLRLRAVRVERAAADGRDRRQDRQRQVSTYGGEA